MSVRAIGSGRWWVLALFVPLCVQGAGWMRGALSVGDSTGEIRVERLGAGADDLGGESGRVGYFPGAVRIDMASEASAFARASNRFAMYFSGPGFWGVERFEQYVSGGAPKGDDQSRMILNVREGRYVADARALPVESQLIVETPVGRLSSVRALWFMDVGYEAQSRIYNFSFECKAGVLRFTDSHGEVFILSGGHRLVGAGRVDTLSIEVSEASRESVEYFETYRVAAEAFDEGRIDLEALHAEMKPLSLAAVETGNATEVKPERAVTNRPVVIEYVPRPESSTPFRGVLKVDQNLLGEPY